MDPGCSVSPHWRPGFESTLPIANISPFLYVTQLTLWINEKMLTAQDTSYDEARNLHSKWLKHQAFMAELASNKDWLNKVDQVCVDCVVLGVPLYLYESIMILCVVQKYLID